jgi:hypothetical protein
MKTLRELLTDIHKRSNFDTDEDTLEETLRELPIVFKGNHDTHRWRVDYDCVAKVEDDGVDRYFMYTACTGVGDNSWEDAGYEFEGIDNVVEVKPVEKTVTDYVLLT